MSAPETLAGAPRNAGALTRAWPGLLLAALVVLIDQLSKAWMMDLLLDPPRLVPVLPVFNLVPVWNRGVSFGLFAGHESWGAWVLTGLALAVSAVLVGWLTRNDRVVVRVGLGLVLGGALGNVVDRLRYGAVFDFLDLYVGSFHPFIFNLADAAITFGVVCLLWDGLFSGSSHPK